MELAALIHSVTINAQMPPVWTLEISPSIPNSMDTLEDTFAIVRQLECTETELAVVLLPHALPIRRL